VSAAHPSAESLRAEADRIEQSAQGVSDSSEYPRVALMACRGQVEALRSYAETVAEIGAEIPPKRAGMTGEERRERRAAILRLRAARLHCKAADDRRRSHDIGSRIPFGQPILVGHHSERGHRRAIEKMHAATGRSIAAENYASELDRRANHVERSHAISASDSDAAEQYRAKLQRLEAEREKMKATNNAWRKYQRSGDAGELESLGFDAHQIETLKLKIAAAYSWERQPFAHWQISNLGAVIRDTRIKLERAEKVATMPDQQIEGAGGIRVEDSPQDNRVRIYFPGKPEPEIRAQLKRNGFRWAPSVGAWQAFRNWRAMEHAKTFIAAEGRPE